MQSVLSIPGVQRGDAGRPEHLKGKQDRIDWKLKPAGQKSDGTLNPRHLIE